MKKIMIIGVGWEQLPLVDTAKKMGCYVIATTQWVKSQINADVIYEIDSRNIEALEQIYIKELPNAIIADECDYSMYAVAYLTEKYHLPGPNLKALTITNNKYLQRKVLDDNKVKSIKQPKYSLCWNYIQALEVAREIGFPIIIKPIDNRGSIGVERINNEYELKSGWFNAVINAHSRTCIIEKYIEGDTITAEGFYDSCKFNFITVSSKDTYKENKNVAKVLYYPGKLNYDQINDIKIYVEDIVKAYGINFGFTHFEFLIEDTTKDIYFIEAANRGGGVYISNKILKEITDIDFAKYLLLMSMGEKVLLNNINLKQNAIMYFFEPLGYIEPYQILNDNKNIIAMHINSSNLKTLNKKQDARARTAVVILSGKDIDMLLIQAKKIEKEMCIINEEFVYGGNYNV